MALVPWRRVTRPEHRAVVIARDVVLANPRSTDRGFPLVAAETARVASMFVGGEAPRFDEVPGGQVTIWLRRAIEHAQVQRAGSDESCPWTSESRPFSVARTTGGVSASATLIASPLQGDPAPHA